MHDKQVLTVTTLLYVHRCCLVGMRRISKTSALSRQLWLCIMPSSCVPPSRTRFWQAMGPAHIGLRTLWSPSWSLNLNTLSRQTFRMSGHNRLPSCMSWISRLSRIHDKHVMPLNYMLNVCCCWLHLQQHLPTTSASSRRHIVLISCVTLGLAIFQHSLESMYSAVLTSVLAVDHWRCYTEKARDSFTDWSL